MNDSKDLKIRGRAWIFPDDVDTDQIIPGKYLTIRNPLEMSKHVFESLSPGFHSQVRSGDIILAGRNFGSGSSREEAPVLLKKLGISLIIGQSFSRLFFRNAINIGLPVIECSECASKTSDGDILEVDLENGVVHNISRKEQYHAVKLPDFLLNILKSGGAVEAYRQTHISK